ncbi:MAG TPA: PspC domain-containing protein [Streptosporangiaceae bacterium]|nr:PspC domain-containing protein [Streptosporangiaceae bacterium]
MNTSAPSSPAAGPEAEQSTTGHTQSSQASPNALVRTRHNRMLAGVASGIARYLGIDVTLVRIAFVLVTLIGGLGIPLYLASWLLIPDEDSAQSIAADFASSVQEWRS